MSDASVISTPNKHSNAFGPQTNRHLPKEPKTPLPALPKKSTKKPVIKDKDIPLEIEDDFSDGDDDVGLSDDIESQIQHLKKSLAFTRFQHTEILRALQKEIDKLKQENQELQFKLVLIQDESGEISLNSNSTNKNILPGYIDDMKKELSLLKERNQYLENLQIQQQKAIEEEQKRFLRKSSRKMSSSQIPPPPPHHHQQHQHNIPLNEFHDVAANALFNDVTNELCFGNVKIVLEPLMIITTNSPSTSSSNNSTSSSREPTLRECESIIKFLVQRNKSIRMENEKLQQELKTRLATKAANKDREISSTITSTSTTTRTTSVANAANVAKLPSIHPMVIAPISLPALRQTISTKVAQRERRTKILQKTRLENVNNSFNPRP